MGYALRADVAQKLADCWLAAHLQRKVEVRATTTNKIIPYCCKLTGVRRHESPENSMLFSCFFRDEQTRATMPAQGTASAALCIRDAEGGVRRPLRNLKDVPILPADAKDKCDNPPTGPSQI